MVQIEIYFTNESQYKMVRNTWVFAITIVSLVPIVIGVCLFSSFFLKGYKIYNGMKKFVFSTLSLFYFFSFEDILKGILPSFSTRIIIYIAVIYGLIKILKIGNPLKFNQQKEIETFLDQSFNILEYDKLFVLFQEFVNNIFGKVKLELNIFANHYGDDFIQFHNDLRTNGNFININSEILKNSELGSKFINKESFPRLYFSLFNNNDKVIGSILVGKKLKQYWTFEEEKFFKEIVNVFNRSINNIIANQELYEQKTQIKIEREVHNRTKDSIEYASLIQNSILPREEEISKFIKEFFIIWKPKDIVGGDFYWFYPIPKSKNYIIAEIDCTGHGVPGAFMSMTANSILNNIVREKNIYEPDKILNLLHKEIRYTLRQQAKESQQDGMDLSLCFIDIESQEIHFAGAMQHLFVVKKQNYSDSSETSLQMIKGDRFSIGGRQKEEERIFTKQIINYNSGDIIYLMSDGLADQKIKIDGKETRLKLRRVKEMLLKYSSLPMDKQKKKIEGELAELQDGLEQRDDITVIGVKL